MLRTENLARCEPPLDERELEAIAKSIGRYPPASPTIAAAPDGSPETIAERNAAIVANALATLENQQQVSSWGWRDCDRTFGPLIAGWLYIIGARPSNGKTTLLLNLLSRLRDDGVPTLYFGTELTPADLVKKWAAIRLRLDELAVFENRLTGAERTAVAQEIRRLLEADTVTFSTVERLNLSRLTAEVQWAFDSATGPSPRVIILDHLHRVTQDREELTALAQELKTIATERRVAMLVAAQLNRDPSVRVFDLYQPPSLSRYKGSAAIEENADVALGLYRPLKRGMTMKQRRAVEYGELPITDFAEPNTLAMLCIKHRYHGAAIGHGVGLVLEGSRLESKSFRDGPSSVAMPESGDAWERDETPF